uniref:ZP domain-containing protein n=1 Tax=Caenorhabditis japonica TaxID=281687 RepID=A0A8R1I548_CAEJA
MIGRSPLESMKPNLFHGDLDDCVNFSLKCREKNLEVKASSMRMFVGKMMTKKSKKIMCEHIYDNEYDFSSKFDFKKCGLDPTKPKDSTYRGTIHVKEGSTSLVTIRDKVLQVNCRMHKSMPNEEQSLSIRMNVRENNKTNHMSDGVVVSSTASSVNPKFSLKVLGIDSTEADTVHIGDYGWIKLEVKNAIEDFTVTNLMARDVISGRVLRIIDEDGCVLRRDIVKEIRKTDNYVKLKISFSGFREQTEVVYHAMVETCTVGCVPKCNQDMMVPENETNVNSLPLSLDLPRHRMVRRSVAGEPRQLQLTSDVYKVTGHKLTLLNPPKMFDYKKTEEASSYEFNEHGEFHDGDVMVVKHAHNLWTGVKHCFVDDITCLLTVILGAIQMFLMFSCVLIMYCYYQQWIFYRELNRPPENNVQFYRTGSPKPQVASQPT